MCWIRKATTCHRDCENDQKFPKHAMLSPIKKAFLDVVLRATSGVLQIALLMQ
jgi:hypothetical protein